MKIGVAAVALNLALNLAFMVPLQHVGPALATSLAAMFNVGWMGAVLARRGQWRPDARLRQRSLRVALAAAAMGLVLWFVQRALFVPTLHGMARLGALAALIVAGLAAYGVAAALFGAGDWRELGRMLTRRRPRTVEPASRP